MKVTKLDDHQSWMISEGDVHVLLDPWLTDRLAPASRAWWMQRERTEPPTAFAKLPRPAAVLVSSHERDHLAEDTLRMLERSVSVHTTARAEKRLRALGFSDVRAHAPGARFDVADTFEITAVVAGFPYAGRTLGFLVESRRLGTRVYFEPHATDEARLLALPPGLDALVCPCESVFASLVQLSMDPERTARTIARLRPKRYVATGVAPGRRTGLFARATRAHGGGVEALTRILAERRLGTEVFAPRTGDVISLS